jgi:hypothetical protein
MGLSPSTDSVTALVEVQVKISFITSDNVHVKTEVIEFEVREPCTLETFKAAVISNCSYYNHTGLCVQQVTYSKEDNVNITIARDSGLSICLRKYPSRVAAVVVVPVPIATSAVGTLTPVDPLEVLTGLTDHQMFYVAAELILDICPSLLLKILAKRWDSLYHLATGGCSVPFMKITDKERG